MKSLIVDGIEVCIVRKNIKNMYLRVTKGGEAVVSVPVLLSNRSVEDFVFSKKEWLKRVLTRTAEMKTHTDSFQDGETRSFLGKEYTLHIDTSKNKGYYFKGNDIVLCVGEGSTAELRKKALVEAYRESMSQILPDLAQKCQEKCGLFAKEWRIRNMKTRWGSCNTKTKRIWISLWLIEKPIECLEAVIYHELTHLKIKGHNKDFYSLLEKNCPDYFLWDSLLKK